MWIEQLVLFRPTLRLVLAASTRRIGTSCSGVARMMSCLDVRPGWRGESVGDKSFLLVSGALAGTERVLEYVSSETSALKTDTSPYGVFTEPWLTFTQ